MVTVRSNHQRRLFSNLASFRHPCDAYCGKTPPDASQTSGPPPQPTETKRLATSRMTTPHTRNRCVTRVGRLLLEP